MRQKLDKVDGATSIVGIAESDEVKVLKAAYEDARRENERLRDARAAVTRQLGPLPISAGVVAGLVAAFDPSSIEHRWLLWVALGLFGVLVLLSILYGNMRPYRLLRGIRGADRPLTGLTEEEWYRTMLKLEDSIYGSRREKWHERRLPSRIESLQEGFERERTGLVLVQGLFAVVIVLLVLSRVA